MPSDLSTGTGSDHTGGPIRAQQHQHQRLRPSTNAVITESGGHGSNATGADGGGIANSGGGGNGNPKHRTVHAPGGGPHHLGGVGQHGSSSRSWATVSWMPHASLSQTSHVAVSVRAALAKLPEDDYRFTRYYGDIIGRRNNPRSSGDEPRQRRQQPPARDYWRVAVTVRGLAGLPLVPVVSKTRSAPVEPLYSEDDHDDDDDDYSAEEDGLEVGGAGTGTGGGKPCRRPLVHESTHVCRWDQRHHNHRGGGGRSLLPIPLRWRDLPRDAYLEFALTGSRGEESLYEPAILPFFDDYGKLRSGLNRLPLFRRKKLHRNDGDNDDDATNPGLAGSTAAVPSSPWQDCDDDPVWKASKILEQLDRFEDQQSAGGIHNNGASTTTTTTRGRQPQQQQQQQKQRQRQLLRKPGSREGSPFYRRGGNTVGNNFGDIPSVPWLDRMARDYCEQTLREAKEASKHTVVWPDDDDEAKVESEKPTPSAYLLVEIPSFDVPVIHEETFYPTPRQGPSGSVTPLDLALYQQARIGRSGNGADDLEPPLFHALSAVPFLDYENENDSPIDDKYRTLAHDLLRGLVDPALKPDRVQRDRLAAIIASPSHHPSREEKDLLWRFRFSLVDNRKALTKFLLAVDWTVEIEVVQAAELLEQWRKRSPIEVTDALKLLGKQVAYQTNLVRAYAIDTLASAPDEELNLYLLQLVQALKFENSLQQEQQLGSDASPPPKKRSSLATFLIARASKNVLLANYLYWYLKVELQDPAHGARYREIFDEFRAALSRAPYPGFLTREPPPVERPAAATTTTTRASNILSSSSMASSASLVNKLGESVSKLVGDKLRGTDGGAGNATAPDPGRSPPRSPPKSRSVWDVLSEQDAFISGVMDVQMSYQSKARQPAKEAHLRSVLAREGYEPPSDASSSSSKSTARGRSSFPMPIAPEILVDGCFPETAKVFKSAVYPALIEFRVDHVVDRALFGSRATAATGGQRATETATGGGGGRPPAAAPPNPPKTTPAAASKTTSSYRVLMKTGDDLRQDQLVMMMIKLMDRLLKRASLDLCITPYSIIATSSSSGMIEFVEESCPLSAVLANHGNSVLQFFRSVAPSKSGKHGIRSEVLSSYVRSVAGGCVLTYLMGVGDRHLDNLMITKTGRFFHIDFGFLFGRDPKPLPPAFRLTREMVEGMGGSESAEYRQFCSLACQAFNALRKSAGLVLNLLHLMSDAGIEDLSNNPSADADGVIAKVEERFRLDLTDEQAERYFLGLINDSLAALAPRLMDVFHSIAVARR